MKGFHLFYALKKIAFRDAGSDRKNTLALYLQHHFFAKYIHRIYKISPLSLRSLLIASYGISQSLLQISRANEKEILLCAKFSNESEELLPHLLEMQTPFSSVSWSIKNILLNTSTFFSSLLILPRLYQILRKISHNPFLIATRQAEFIFTYLHYKKSFQKQMPKAIVTFSESAPYALAPALAAKSFGIKTIFFSHGYPVSYATGLCFDNNFLSGPDAQEVHQKNGVIIGQTFFKGIVGENILFSQRSENKNLLILASLLLNVDYIKKIAPSLIKNFSNLNVRVHPKTQIVNPGIYQELEHAGFQVLSNQVSMESQIKKNTYVLTGNTSAALRAVKLGSYTFYDSQLDDDEKSLFSFLNAGLCYEPNWEELSLSEIQEFYSRPSWVSLFLKYDPFYLQLLEKKNSDFQKNFMKCL